MEDVKRELRQIIAILKENDSLFQRLCNEITNQRVIVNEIKQILLNIFQILEELRWK